MHTRREGAPATGARSRFVSGRTWFVACGLTLLSACASMPRTAAVDSLGPAAKPLKDVAALLGAQYSKDDRNRWIEFNLIRIDGQYAIYEARLRALRTKWNVGTSTAALLFNVASSLTDSAGVKANYVAANTLAVGANQIVSKEEFLEQTVNTLVTGMQGRRAEMRKRVRIGMTRSPEEYTVSDAYTDLQAYDSAGSLTQGMNFVTDATKKETDDQVKQADAEVKKALIFSEEEKQLAFCISDSLEHRPLDAVALAKVLDALEVKYPQGADADAMISSLDDAREFSTAAFEKRLHQLMQTNNLLKPCRRYQ